MLSKLFILLVFLLQFISGYGQVQDSISLALSGGGAKGFAHIGVLKAIEEYGLDVKKINGTSMGAIIATFYASGYSADEIHELMKEFVDTDSYFSDYSRRDISIHNKFNKLRNVIDFGVQNYNLVLPKALASDTRINFFLMKHFSGISLAVNNDFKKLQRNLSIYASDIVKERAIQFQSGNLSKVIRGSVAFPIALAPLEFDNNYYLDGGIYKNLATDNFPEEDYVVAVNVGSKTSSNPENLLSFTDMSLHLINLLSSKSDSLSVKNWDLFIEPQMGEYTSTSWNALDSLIDRGYEAAIEAFERKGFKKRVNHQKRFKVGLDLEHYKIDRIQISGVKQLSKAFIETELNLKKGERFSWENVKNGMNRLYVQRLINAFWIDFEFSSRNRLIVKISVKEETLTRFGVGAYYSDVMGNNVFFNLDFVGKLKKGETISLNTKVGNHSNALKFGVNVPHFVGISSFEQITMEISNDRYRMLDRSEFSFLRRAYEFNSGLLLDRNMMLLGQASYRIGETTQNDSLRLNYYTQASLKAGYELDNLDDLFFPTKGQLLELSFKYSFITDRLRNDKKFTYSLFKYHFLNYTNLFRKSIIFSHELRFNTIIGESNMIPLIETPRSDLTRATLGYYDSSLYGNHQAIGTLSLKVKLRERLYAYISGSFGKSWADYRDISLKSIQLKSLKKGYEIGLYAPLLIGPVMLTYSSDDNISNVFRFTIGYLF